ncbi:mitochondrial ribosomal protein L53 [Nomia melanderi]|uniref:mitochondrial ribosomal protein L53 n=1 Tax=Nomia melanderi TaxID=2448451 RepID=UPI00130424E8|nr:39S ribosomal protein L53, mitochondrial [Nomia melanderi]
MSIPLSGSRSRSGGIISAIAKHLRSLTLKPVKSINVKFDPFDYNALQTRDFFFHITTPKIFATNPNCTVKPQIVSDLSEPVVTFKLLSGDNVVVKSANLTSLNILELYNKHITPLAPSEPETGSERTAADKEEKKKRKKRMKYKRESKNRPVFL